MLNLSLAIANYLHMNGKLTVSAAQAAPYIDSVLGDQGVTENIQSVSDCSGHLSTSYPGDENVAKLARAAGALNTLMAPVPE